MRQKWHWQPALLALVLPATTVAREPGPGIVVTCEEGTVTKANSVMVTHPAAPERVFAIVAEEGQDSAEVCDDLLFSAKSVKLKAEKESNKVVVIYGKDVRVIRMPQGIKYKVDKF